MVDAGESDIILYMKQQSQLLQVWETGFGAKQ